MLARIRFNQRWISNVHEKTNLLMYSLLISVKKVHDDDEHDEGHMNPNFSMPERV